MQRWLLGIFFLLLSLSVYTNEATAVSFNAANKIFIITLDGLRWQEIFQGADSTLLNNSNSNSEAAGITNQYWHPSQEERRKKLFPFFWTVLAQQGRLYGNRDEGSRMNVSNPYALSYPGYNELLTGEVDLSIFGNGKAINPNRSILDYLAATQAYKGKVAAFASWDAFPYILHKSSSSVFINSGAEELADQTGKAGLLQTVQKTLNDQKHTRDDEVTFLACEEYVQKNEPSVVFLSFGGTDEAAHKKHYHEYLQQAHNADRMIGELWNFLQSLPAYAGHTSFLVTTDHGRGRNDDWYTHGMFVAGSSQTWMGLLGKGVESTQSGSCKGQYYQKDVKKVILRMLTR